MARSWRQVEIEAAITETEAELRDLDAAHEARKTSGARP
jgi:hypothetical protein